MAAVKVYDFGSRKGEPGPNNQLGGPAPRQAKNVFIAAAVLTVLTQKELNPSG
jgi:hypothetical protein